MAQPTTKKVKVKQPADSVEWRFQIYREKKEYPIMRQALIEDTQSGKITWKEHGLRLSQWNTNRILPARRKSSHTLFVVHLD